MRCLVSGVLGSLFPGCHARFSVTQIKRVSVHSTAAQGDEVGKARPACLCLLHPRLGPRPGGSGPGNAPFPEHHLSPCSPAGPTLKDMVATSVWYLRRQQACPNRSFQSQLPLPTDPLCWPGRGPPRLLRESCASLPQRLQQCVCPSLLGPRLDPRGPNPLLCFCSLPRPPGVPSNSELVHQDPHWLPSYTASTRHSHVRTSSFPD